MEMIFDNGGEEGFVGQMVEESHDFQLDASMSSSSIYF